MPNPGFGNSPRSLALRVLAVGSTSPRWTSARNNADADRRNEHLALARADNARLIIEQLLKRDLPGVTIVPGVSRLDKHIGAEVELGSYGVGSRESLVRRHGDRRSNEAADRSVKISIELITTEYGQAGVSLPDESVSARTKFWYVTVTRYYVDAVAVAMGYARIRLRNSLSGKTMDGEVYLYGGGLSTAVLTDPKRAISAVVLNRLKAAARDAIGRSEISFYTDREMSFRDFDGKFVTFERAKAQIFLGAQLLYLTFRNLGDGAALIPIQHAFAWGIRPGLEGYVVSGLLHMIGDYPGDTIEYSRTATVPTEIDRTSGDSMTIEFATGQSVVTALERHKMEKFVHTWTQQMGAL